MIRERDSHISRLRILEISAGLRAVDVRFEPFCAVRIAPMFVGISFLVVIPSSLQVMLKPDELMQSL